MVTPLDETKLKEILKTAVAEVLEERRDFVKELVEEAMEDIALARAIDEGLSTQTVARDDVFNLLENGR
jgi:hypothetical protein